MFPIQEDNPVLQATLGATHTHTFNLSQYSVIIIVVVILFADFGVSFLSMLIICTHA